MLKKLNLGNKKILYTRNIFKYIMYTQNTQTHTKCIKN